MLWYTSVSSISRNIHFLATKYFSLRYQLISSPSLWPLFEDSLCPVTCLCRAIKSWCQMRSAEATVMNDLWVNPSLCPNTLPSLYTGIDLNSISKKFDFCLRVCYLGNWTCNSIFINSNCLFPRHTKLLIHFFTYVLFVLHSFILQQKYLE